MKPQLRLAVLVFAIAANAAFALPETFSIAQVYSRDVRAGLVCGRN